KVAEIDKRLYSGTITAPRELQALQADVASLRRRKSDLEDKILETMQEGEPLDAEVSRLAATRAELEQEADQLRQAIAEATQTIDTELATETDARATAASSVPEELLDQYERLRATLGGIGAARLGNGRRSGCRR